MRTWTLQPRDPLIARDGRPFSAAPGARAKSLPLPMPAMLAGVWRTRRGNGHFDAQSIERLKSEGVMGPLLVQLDAQGRIAQWAVPAPADAVLFGDEAPVERRRLVPRSLRDHEQTDLAPGLSPLFLGSDLKTKPAKSTPSYWTWEAFAEWLLKAEDGPWKASWAFEGPIAESRTHVGVLAATGTAAEGALFSTEGRRFQTGTRQDGFRQLALAFRVTVEEDEEPWVGPAGGERRLAYCAPSGTDWPAMPRGLMEQILEQRACRLILLTPALFAGGWQPEWLLGGDPGVKVTLTSAAVGRPEVISGWDLERRQPKPTRRAVRGGSVYFLRLEGDETAIRRWVERLWLAPVSDAEQDRLDGFGLAALGAWAPEGV